MLTHEQIWFGIDLLAKAKGLSPSGLAKKAGLDPTTFNKSKRVTGQGKPRWPSTESISKILIATNTTMVDFLTLMSQGSDQVFETTDGYFWTLSWSKAQASNAFDSAGFPTTEHWNRTVADRLGDGHNYSILVDGPIAGTNFRKNDRLVISPNAAVRAGHGVVVKKKDGKIAYGVVKSSGRDEVRLEEDGEVRKYLVGANRQIKWMSKVIAVVYH